jgi:predicted deacylase
MKAVAFFASFFSNSNSSSAFMKYFIKPNQVLNKQPVSVPPLCLALFALLNVAACTVNGPTPARFCESSRALIDANFSAGNFYQCSFLDVSTVAMEIRPEDAPPINPSPWYAFRVSPKEAGEITVRLNFSSGYPRYWPKISGDGDSWEPLAAQQVNILKDDNAMELSLQTDLSTFWVAAQEVLLPADYERWMTGLGSRPGLSKRTIGRSVQGRPINVLETPAKPEVLIFLGRQHPPEVTGALAMQSFIDSLFTETELARRFRQRFAIIIIPLINPDGVVAGHWRHNMNGVDLNRDWGPFTQPETQSIETLLSEIETKGMRPRLMLDFHSTQRSRFYTQLKGELGGEVDFASSWLDQARLRLPDFDYLYDPRPPSDQENTKNYFFSRYQIPAITYEIGDAVDRKTIFETTPIFAEEMMRILLEAPKQQLSSRLGD